MKLSKTTLNMAKRLNIELCECFDDELHIIIDPENNDCASVAYKLNDKKQYTLVNSWDNNIQYPSILKEEKDIRNTIKLMVK